MLYFYIFFYYPSQKESGEWLDIKMIYFYVLLYLSLLLYYYITLVFIDAIILGLFEAHGTKRPTFLSKLGLKSWKIGRLDNFLICKFSQTFEMC
jgi:hypothetical protein